MAARAVFSSLISAIFRTVRRLTTALAMRSATAAWRGITRSAYTRATQSVKERTAPCYCYIKMSWGNCSVKMSSPHGDIHDEPEGVAPGGVGHRRAGRTYQQP